jgi:hypothetical protein
MKTNMGFVIVVAAGVLAVGAYMLWRTPDPAPASGGEAPRTALDEVAEARAVVARINARSELTASGEPISSRAHGGAYAERPPAWSREAGPGG